MSSITDEIMTDGIVALILGAPIIIGIVILSIPILIVSGITGIDEGVLVKNLLAFAIAVFLVWLFSRFQIIENGIVALIAGTMVHKYFGWHSLVCILIGLMAVGLLFYITSRKIGFWIKTIPFSLIITVIIYAIFYSEGGLLPLPDKVWKISFFIVFFLENIFIRCSVAYNRESQSDKSGDIQAENKHDPGKGQIELTTTQPVYNENQANNSTNSEINNLARKMNAEILGKQVDEEVTTYLMDRVYLFSQRKSFWDGKIEENIEEKIYQTLKMFIDDAYIILPHIAFREIFWWGDWWTDPNLTDRVTKMHFDFGIYNADFQPILFIEVYGKSHKEDPRVMERDKFKAEVMKRCGMKLITIDCLEAMTDQEIRDKLIACIKAEVPDRKAYAAYCPHCKSHGKNNLMIIKSNKKGTYFYGCSTYEENKQDNCPGVSIEAVPPLYYGIPLFKE